MKGLVGVCMGLSHTRAPNEAVVSMRPVTVYATVSPAGCRDLLAAVHGRWRQATRAIMILLSADGMSPAEIGELLHCQPITVRRWIGRYRAGGLCGLADRPRSGRPPVGSPRIGERICRLLAVPRAWTVPRLWRALGRPNMSLRTLQRRVRAVASWRRPRLVAKSDPHRLRICRAIRATIAGLPVGAVVLAEDETHLDLLARLRSRWIIRGQRARVNTPGSNRRRSLFGALNLTTGAWHYHPAVRPVSVVFCYFLQLLLAAYPTAPTVVVICDNATIHHSGITTGWLAAHPRLLLIEGARYSPQDNPVERVWATLKAWTANSAPATIADRLRQAHAFFRNRSPDQMITTAAPWTSPWLPKGYEQNFRKTA